MFVSPFRYLEALFFLTALSSFKSLKEEPPTPPPPIGKCPRRQQNASVLNASHFLTR